MLGQLILWTAGILTVLTAVSILGSIMMGETAWGQLMMNDKGTQPTLPRATFLFGNLGLAVTFLMGLLNAEMSPENLREITSIFGGLDLTALSGAAASTYIWSRLGHSDNRGNTK